MNGATKVQDILDKINNATGNGGKLVASFDEAKQQFVFTDKTTPTEATSAATSVTQTGSPVFYGREGGTPVAVPKSGAATSETLNFALRVGTLSERFFVTVVGDTYTGSDAEMKAAWLADIKNEIKQAMQDAGQLKIGEAAVVDVKFIGGQLIFDSAKTLTIWTDTTKGNAVPFKVEAQNDSKALGQLGLVATTANTEGTVVTGSKMTAVGADAVAKKEFDASTKVDTTADAEHHRAGGQSWSEDGGCGCLQQGWRNGDGDRGSDERQDLLCDFGWRRPR